MQRILVLGAGGHAKSVIDILERMPDREVVGVIASAPAADATHAGYPVLGDDAQLAAVVERHGVDGCVVAIGDNWTRARVARMVGEAVPSLRFTTVIHPSAQIARAVTIGDGTVVAGNAVVERDAHIGAHAYISMTTVVGHDVSIGDYATLGPHAVLCGAARLGEYAMVGAGANVLQNIVVGEHTVIGAGSTVTRDVPAYAVAYGSPARVMRQRQAGERYL
jgi:sugar O-acyltransferase (sialic acid O-acetyltransferase NeuD family)